MLSHIERERDWQLTTMAQLSLPIVASARCYDPTLTAHPRCCLPRLANTHCPSSPPLTTMAQHPPQLTRQSISSPIITITCHCGLASPQPIATIIHSRHSLPSNHFPVNYDTLTYCLWSTGEDMGIGTGTIGERRNDKFWKNRVQVPIWYPPKNYIFMFFSNKLYVITE